MVNLCLQPPTVNPSSLSSVGRRRRREGLLFLLSPLIFISVSVIPPASALPLRVRITRVKRSSSSCQQSHNKQGARLSSSTTRRCIMDEGNLTGDHTARDAIAVVNKHGHIRPSFHETKYIAGYISKTGEYLRCQREEEEKEKNSRPKSSDVVGFVHL